MRAEATKALTGEGLAALTADLILWSRKAEKKTYEDLSLPEAKGSKPVKLAGRIRSGPK